MQYDIIAVDMFNLFYRIEHTSLDKNPISIARNMVAYINDTVKPHLAEEGKLFLLYDPIPKSDLGLNKTFKYTERQEIIYAYKRNRTHNRKCLTVVDLVRKYFLHRGPNVISVISNKYEADDFMESIALQNKGKDIAMITNDNDWARYLEQHNVVMINSGWEKPYTAEAFENDYKFRPSITGVCVWKACFGDNSDNIKGALQLKSLKNANQVKITAFEYINYLGTHPEISIQYIFEKKNEKIRPTRECKNIEERFFSEIYSFDPKYDVESTFFQNIQAIRSRCDSYEKFASAKDEDEKFNSLIEKTLGFRVDEEKQFKFGHIKG